MLPAWLPQVEPSLCLTPPLLEMGEFRGAAISGKLPATAPDRRAGHCYRLRPMSYRPRSTAFSCRKPAVILGVRFAVPSLGPQAPAANRDC